RIRELVVKYKAEKACHEEMVTTPLVDLKVLEDGSFRMCIDYRELSKIDLYWGCHQMRMHEDKIPKTTFRMRYGRYEFTAMPYWVDQYTNDFYGHEFGAAEEREVSCEAQQGRSEVKRKLIGSCRNNMVARYGVHVSNILDKDGMYIEVLERDVEVVRNTSRYERGRSPVLQAEMRESKMIGLELEKETTNVVVIKERLKETKDRQEIRFGKNGELAPRLFARLIEEFGFALHRDLNPYEVIVLECFLFSGLCPLPIMWFEKYKAFNDRTIDYDKLKRKLNETLRQLAQKDIEIKEGLKTKAYELLVVKEKHDELIKQGLLTKSHYEGLVKQKTKVITDLKLREEHDIDKMLSMEKQLKFLNEIVYKRSQSIQTIHMMAPKVKEKQKNDKIRQKQEACRSREKFKAVTVGRGRKTEQNAKRMAKN
nr:hypothetical protein [Tanacetum cinerariifolium]